MIDQSNIRWIITENKLNEVSAELIKKPLIGLDTEFKRENTFFPQAALIQLSDGESVWLIDPTQVAPTEAFRALLRNQHTIKLLHAASEDLEVLLHWAQVLPEPLIDTQIAQTFCEKAQPMSYQNLVNQLIHIELDKSLTRSDWLKRPLTPQQQYYAALDAFYLPAIWQIQFKILETKSRIIWVQEESARLLAQARQSHQWQQYHLRQRNLWRLSAIGHMAYKHLCLWRETLARRSNKPRNWILSDQILFALAQALPHNRYQLAQIGGIKPKFIKHYADTLLDLINQAKKSPQQEWPKVPFSPQFGPYRQRLAWLKQAVHELAERLQLEDQQILTRREIDDWIQSDLQQNLHELTFHGWRKTYLSSLQEQMCQEFSN